MKNISEIFLSKKISYTLYGLRSGAFSINSIRVSGESKKQNLR